MKNLNSLISLIETNQYGEYELKYENLYYNCSFLTIIVVEATIIQISMFLNKLNDWMIENKIKDYQVLIIKDNDHILRM